MLSCALCIFFWEELLWLLQRGTGNYPPLPQLICSHTYTLAFSQWALKKCLFSPHGEGTDGARGGVSPNLARHLTAATDEEQGSLKTAIAPLKGPDFGIATTLGVSVQSLASSFYNHREREGHMKISNTSLLFTKRRLTEQISWKAFVSEFIFSASRWQWPVPTLRKQLYYLRSVLHGEFSRITRSHPSAWDKKDSQRTFLKSHLFSFLLCLLIKSSLG